MKAIRSSLFDSIVFRTPSPLKFTSKKEPNLKKSRNVDC